MQLGRWNAAVVLCSVCMWWWGGGGVYFRHILEVAFQV